jgi:hypothetical protein
LAYPAVDFVTAFTPAYFDGGLAWIAIYYLLIGLAGHGVLASAHYAPLLQLLLYFFMCVALTVLSNHLFQIPILVLILFQAIGVV